MIRMQGFYQTLSPRLQWVGSGAQDYTQGMCYLELYLSVCLFIYIVRGKERCQLLEAVHLGSDHFQLFTEFKPVLTAMIKDHILTMEERSAVSVCVCVCVC